MDRFLKTFIQDGRDDRERIEVWECRQDCLAQKITSVREMDPRSVFISAEDQYDGEPAVEATLGSSPATSWSAPVHQQDHDDLFDLYAQDYYDMLPNLKSESEDDSVSTDP